ncbi:MAG: WYL domain-containing protein [Actinobacteria bacterium]|nr:WYL domain-containing protein [Actinomycetota bacterium]
MTGRRTTANERVRRLLSVVPWIVARDGPRVDEVCERFGMTRAQLLDDLQIVFLVGLFPFTPDQLIDVVIEDDRVWIRLADYFAEPMRLTPDQGFQIVAAGAGLLSVPGSDPDGPLARAIAKLAAVLGVDADDVQIDLGEAEPLVLGSLRTAVADRRPVQLDYHTFGRDVRGVRVVEPHRLSARDGAWYLEGFCRSAGAPRVFRIDRIDSVEVLDEVLETPIHARSTDPGAPYVPAADEPRILLELDAEAAWVVEQYPVDAVEDLGNGRRTVRLGVSGEAWLERLLLRLGPHGRLVEVEAPLDPMVASRAAERILRRYETSSSGD